MYLYTYIVHVYWTIFVHKNILYGIFAMKVETYNDEQKF